MASSSEGNKVVTEGLVPSIEHRCNTGPDCAGPVVGAAETGQRLPTPDLMGSDSNFHDEQEDSTEEKDASHTDDADGEQTDLWALWTLLQHRLGINFAEMSDEPQPQVLEELSLSGIAAYIQAEKCKNIIVMTGAGISTSAGIPDFRSPGSGLYANLEKYNLPSPESIFDISYFKGNPDPFFMLAKELFPGNYKATISHYFISLLAQKGLLLRTYTQNIDGLERKAGIQDDLIVAAHGTFHTSHCINCKQEYSEEWMKGEIFKDAVPKCTSCEGLVKPDIIFFGESLPSKFFQMMPTDFRQCDLLVVMGTSLVVQPFASLIDRVPKETPRLLINKEKCGVGLFSFFGGFNFDGENTYRDVAWLGTCDDGCLELAEKLGWKEELLKMAAKDGVFPPEPSANAESPGSAIAKACNPDHDGAAKYADTMETKPLDDSTVPQPATKDSRNSATHYASL